MTEVANLGDAISRAVALKLDAAFVEKEVESRIGKLVVEAVDSALRRYSDTGKLIEQAIEDALRVDHIDLPSYGAVVAAMLKTQIEAKVSELVAGRLAADMDELLGLAPKEVKLSEIAKAMIEQGDHGQDYGDAITVIVGTNEYRSTWVYLDETKVIDERNKYQCRHSLLIREDGTIASATVDGNDTKGGKQHIGRSYGIGQLLRAYVACGTKIILDEHAVVTSVGDY